MSLLAATVSVGVASLALAVIGLSSLHETFDVELDFHER
jgi:hypothetical protein